jgi:hypothetical protein
MKLSKSYHCIKTHQLSFRTVQLFIGQLDIQNWKVWSLVHFKKKKAKNQSQPWLSANKTCLLPHVSEHKS